MDINETLKAIDELADVGEMFTYKPPLRVQSEANGFWPTSIDIADLKALAQSYRDLERIVNAMDPLMRERLAALTSPAHSGRAIK